MCASLGLACYYDRRLTSALQRAIEIVQRAIDEDQKQNYAEAYKLYQNSLDYFMLAMRCAWRLTNVICALIAHTGVSDEKNERTKALIRTKFEEYIQRAEMLKTHLQAPDNKTTKRAVGANGAGTKKGCVPSLRPISTIALTSLACH